MIQKIVSSRLLWAILSFVLIVQIIIFDYLIINVPEQIQVQYIPDDAYYYLVLARNFTKFGFWTFDSGLSITSGFHPLLAYMLSLIFGIFHPTTNEFVRYSIILHSFITFVVVLFTWFLSLKQEQPYYLIFLTLLISTNSFIYNSVSITEWSLVVLLTVLYTSTYIYNYNRYKIIVYFLLFILGVLGSLSRTDFGLLPFSIFVTALTLLLMRINTNTSSIFASLTGLAGAILGVLITLIHNYLFTGNLIQSSVRIKYY